MKLLYIPFKGTKKYSVKHIREIIEKYGYDTIYEPFGGSMCISVNLVGDGVNCYANDYDKLKERLPNILKARVELYERVKDKVTPQEDPLNEEDRAIIYSAMEEMMNKYNVSLQDISSGYTFGATTNRIIKPCDIKYFRLYTTVGNDRMGKFNEELQKVNIDSLDYIDYIKKYQQYFNKNTLLILDPPYLNSNQKGYENDKYFGIKDTIELLTYVKSLNVDFIIYNQIEEDLIALLKLLNLETKEIYRISNAIHNNKDVKGDTLGKGRRTDCMVYIQNNPYTLGYMKDLVN